MNVERAYELVEAVCRRIMESAPHASVRVAAASVMLGIPASFVAQGVEPRPMEQGVYVLEMPTKQKRVYRAYLFEDELELYRRLVREFSGTERLLQYHMRRILNSLSQRKLTWKDMQALKLVARGRGDMVMEYDVRRLASVVEAITSTLVTDVQ